MRAPYTWYTAPAPPRRTSKATKDERLDVVAMSPSVDLEGVMVEEDAGPPMGLDPSFWTGEGFSSNYQC